ncbi:MAG: preprotein translocase subunit YajC [Gammaproteobacteria bacterium]|jgi:preprotein translocase subunit YajC|nr:preprotein translocase subunit YajC [Gammaproteobacteria bacterium]
MSFFISDAYAAASSVATPVPNSGLNTLIMVGIFVLALYFIMLRPQQKRVKEHRNLINSLAKGDEIITNGGLLGKITNISDHFLTISIAENVEIKIQKSAISTTVPKGTIKSA